MIVWLIWCSVIDDKEEAECTFQPKINRMSVRGRNRDKLDIGEYLHNQVTRSSIERAKSNSLTRYRHLYGSSSTLGKT